MDDGKVITKNDLKHKVVLVRVDFNVPMEGGIIQSIRRIQNAAVTVQFLKEAGAKIVLMAHLGKTSVPNPDQSFRMIFSHNSLLTLLFRAFPLNTSETVPFETPNLSAISCIDTVAILH